ncbi:MULTISPECIES: amino acid ABC transporter permease [Kitasatospora]|uniref:Putative glutamate ABC transporter permease protein n=1 Tax=Kitasatospora setae (strain ATCC 33774 / DSM 43861 / JCM 3304 / KCC A-0304 / NBRC 14216 / KM-6054) TaxID=452652 RepID=E4N8N4_KITSK|nr:MULTISPECIES: amino acid ABC transporter permease [Kitasatospora]BAJ27565.1 putative glutamate ABC transporter permease protein [Kitasatospora setae KM-6054]
MTVESSALYDVPGPKALARHRLYGWLALLAIAAVLGWVVYMLFHTEQFTYQKWMPFEYKGVQELLLRGLGNTLRAFGWTVLFALPFGALFAAGRLSEHRAVRWVSTVVVEFFRAMPLLVMIFFIFVALKAPPMWALVAGLALYNGSVLAEVFRAGVLAVPRGQKEAAYALGLRKTQVMAYVLVPQANRAMLPAIVSQLVVALKDTSLGFLITYEEFLHAGKLIATNLDYDLPFIPVVMVIAPVYIGMCLLLSWFAKWLERRGRRDPKVRGGAPVAPTGLTPDPQG